MKKQSHSPSCKGLLVQLMADEIMVEELRERCAEAVESVRGCPQADAASKAK